MMFELNSLDFCLMALIGFSTLISFSRGLVRELSSLANWIVALWFGFLFHQPMAASLPAAVQPEAVRLVIGFACVFGLVLISGTLLNSIISWIVYKTGLTGPDRLFGLLFGAARGILFATLLILLAKTTPLSDSDLWKTSYLIPQFAPFEYWLYDLLPYEFE